MAELAAELAIAHLASARSSESLQPVLKQIKQDLPAIEIELVLIESHVVRAKKLKEIIANHFYTNVSMHGSKAVADVCKRIGIKSHDVWQSVQAAGHSHPQKDLDDWTDKRHKIIHQGAAPSVRREDARIAIELINCIVSYLDKCALDAMK